MLEYSVAKKQFPHHLLEEKYIIAYSCINDKLYLAPKVSSIDEIPLVKDFEKRPERPFLNYHHELIFNSKEEAQNYRKLTILPLLIKGVNKDIDNIKNRLNPNNWEKVAGFQNIVKSKLCELPKSPFYENLEDLRAILADKLKILKELQEELSDA